MLATLQLVGVLLLSVSASAAPRGGTFPSYDTKTREAAIRFSHKATTAYDKHVQVSTYVSPPMALAPGEVVFTKPDKTHIQMPPGRVAVLGFHAEVVTKPPGQSTYESVPLSEVYNHHWLVFDGKGNAGVCKGYLEYKFGVGAECRNTPVAYPDGYGVVLDGTETWGANIHLLRTVGIAGGVQGVKECIECWYAPNKGCKQDQSGTFACCGDGSFCPTSTQETASGGAVANRQAAASKKVYYLRYNVTWTDQVETIKHLEIYVLDASGCDVEYNVGGGTALPKPRASEINKCYTVPHNASIVFAVGHQHIGGSNISLSLGDGGMNQQTLCTSHPTYGTVVGVPGNEKGYLTGISYCDNIMGVHLLKGAQICVRSLYNVSPQDTRSAPIPGGPHGGVMSLFYIAAHAEGSSSNHHGAHHTTLYIALAATGGGLLIGTVVALSIWHSRRKARMSGWDRLLQDSVTKPEDNDSGLADNLLPGDHQLAQPGRTGGPAGNTPYHTEPSEPR